MTTRNAGEIGWKAGWADAERYVRGDRRTRAALRRRYRRAYAQSSPLRDAWLRIFSDRLECFAAAIAEGRFPRTIRPSKLYYLCNGHGAE